MSSLEAWNNFLQEGFEILGDDFEPLKDYGRNFLTDLKRKKALKSLKMLRKWVFLG